MRLTLITIGRPRDRHLRALLEGYLERIGRYARVEHIHLPDAHRGDRDAVRRQQSQALLQAVPNRAKTIILDERGRAWTSEDLAKRIEFDALHGDSHWALLIGGAEGHDPELRAKADYLWSLSTLTLPHELAALFVAEQLYRAMTILRGEPYHRGD